MSDSEKTNPPSPPDQLVWIDLEMTGLDPDRDQIIETALLLTDKDLNITGRGPAHYHSPPSGDPHCHGQLES